MTDAPAGMCLTNTAAIHNTLDRKHVQLRDAIVFISRAPIAKRMIPMSDPTAHAKLIERLRARADNDDPECETYQLLHEAADALAAAPGLVLPEMCPQDIFERAFQEGINGFGVSMALTGFYDDLRAHFATPAPLAAQSHDQAIVRALSRRHAAHISASTIEIVFISIGEAQAAFDALRAAQSPPPRGEPWNGKTERRNNLEPMNHIMRGKDRRAQPQSEKTQADLAGQIASIYAGISEFTNACDRNQMIINELTKRNLRIVSDGGG